MLDKFGKPIAYGTMVPIGFATAVTLIVTEATGQAVGHYRDFATVDEHQITAAQ